MPYNTGFHTGELPFTPRSARWEGKYDEIRAQLPALEIGGEWFHIDQLTEAELLSIQQMILSYAKRHGDGWKLTTRRQRDDQGTFTLWVKKINS